MKSLFTLCFIFIFYASSAQTSFDVVVLGANPGGLTTGIAAAQLGKSVLILERTNHIGGLPANGLGATDIDTRAATTGLFLEFVDRVKASYVAKYGVNSQQVKDCQEGYHFEPSVAEQVFKEMLSEYPRIKVLKNRQFDALKKNVKFEGKTIKSILVTNRQNQKAEWYSARVFIDGTYEGDLAAAAGVPFKVGREDGKEYNEIGAGKVYKFWAGPEIDSLTTHKGDTTIQSYNYRVNLTKVPGKKVEFQKPPKYNRNEYLSLVEDVLQGRQQALGPMKTGIDVIVNSVSIPNGKVDANNQHAALISTDLPEENWYWPKANWAWRDAFAERLRSYILGLFYFAANDTALPLQFRNQVKEWGLAKDEYQDNQNFPRQVYVREGRRIVGLHLFTANDALPVKGAERPPVYPSSITSGHYSLDSHATYKREEGKPVLEGFLSYKTKPYTIPLEVMIPKGVENLLCPVPVSGTHIGFSTLRMEPCWMAMGQAAGVTASLMIDKKLNVKQLPIQNIQDILLNQQATLIYYEDVPVNDARFKMVQKLGLKGYLPGYKARLDDQADETSIREWEKKAGIKLNVKDNSNTRAQVLKQIYDSLTNQKRL
jgi:hypothetical protein